MSTRYLHLTMVSLSCTYGPCLPLTCLTLWGCDSDEPESSRKPLRRPQVPRGTGDKAPSGLVQAFSSLSTLTESDTENTRPVPDEPAASIPSLFRVSAGSATPSTPTPKTPARKAPKSTTSSSATKTPRTSKKALALAEQAERAAYAQSLFDDLNRSVFGGGLPETTTLVWSNRLLTTAGRARWQRWVIRLPTSLFNPQY